ncbi:hypothetical protein Tco_1228702 [Tanacetum coccineum]
MQHLCGVQFIPIVTMNARFVVDLLDHLLSYALTVTADVPSSQRLKLFEELQNKVGHQGVIDKVNAFYTKNLAQPWQTMLKGTHRSTPRAHMTPTLTVSPQGNKRKQSAEESSSPRQSHKITIKRKKPSTTPIPPPIEAQENIANVQEKLAEEEIEKLVEGDEDKESYASEFVDSVLNDDVDDFGTRLEPGSHKENPEKKDGVEIEKEKNDEEIENEKNNDNIEETDKVIKEKDIVDDVTGSTKIRKEQKQTPIPSPTTRSPRNVSSSDKTVSEELTAIASPTTATTSKASSITKHKKQSISFRFRRLYRSSSHICVVPSCAHSSQGLSWSNRESTTHIELRVSFPPSSVDFNKDREVDPIKAKEMIAKEFETHRPKMIEELFESICLIQLSIFIPQ